MSFCDPYGLGQDFCAIYGNETIDRSDCATGWNDHANYGQLDAAGCGVGCASCYDYPDEMALQADRRDGSRWLRPVGPTRDAMGRQHDLRTDQPWPIPDGAAYEHGSCYHSRTAEQCFNRSVCRRQCWLGGLARINSPDGQSPCGSIDVGQPVDDWFPDVYRFGSDSWPPAIYCRRFHDPSDHRAGLGQRRLRRMLGPAFPRFQQIPFDFDNSQQWSCQPNILVACCDTFTGGECPSAFAQDPNGPHDFQHWIPHGADRAFWDEARIDARTIAVGGGPGATSEAAAAVRTAALRHAATVVLPGGPNGTRFDRLDHDPGEVSLWRRSWNAAAFEPAVCDVLADPGTVIARFPRCRRRADGKIVPMTAHVLAVDFAMYLVLHRLRRYRSPALSDTLHVEPHARFVASVVLAWRSERPDLVPNPVDCREPPGDVDYLDDSGRAFRPPRLVEWFGYHGRLGIGGAREYDLAVTIHLPDQCRSAAAGLNGLPIPGWPHRRSLEATPAAWPYLGAVTLRFET